MSPLLVDALHGLPRLSRRAVFLRQMPEHPSRPKPAHSGLPYATMLIWQAELQVERVINYRL